MFYMKVPVSLLYNTLDQAMASVLLLCNKLDTSDVVKDKAQPILFSAQPTVSVYSNRTVMYLYQLCTLSVDKFSPCHDLVMF